MEIIRTFADNSNSTMKDENVNLHALLKLINSLDLKALRVFPVASKTDLLVQHFI